MLQGRLENKHPKRRADFGLAQVNIVLLLVLFFLVVGTIVDTDELSVELPLTEDLPLERLPRPLLLIEETGGWVLDGEPVDPADAIARLASDQETGAPVHILAPREMPADDLLRIMGELAPSGRAMMLVTLKDEELEGSQ